MPTYLAVLCVELTLVQSLRSLRFKSWGGVQNRKGEETTWSPPCVFHAAALTAFTSATWASEKRQGCIE